MLARRHEVPGLSACTDPDHQLPRTERLQLDTKNIEVRFLVLKQSCGLFWIASLRSQ